MRPFFSFGKDIGIDLGTANTLVFMRGQGIILREPSVVAVDTRTDTVRYVGQEAKDVIGRTPGSIVAVRPLKDGVIADFDITANMLQIFIPSQCGSLHSVGCYRCGAQCGPGGHHQGRRPEGCHH